MHAGWNLACKAKTPSAAFFTLSTSSSVLLMTPLYLHFAPHLKNIPGPVWGILAVTGFFQTLYYVSLGNAYRLSEMSLAYPMIRSLPVLMVPMVCGMVGYGRPVSGVSLAGMVIIALGCMALPLTGLGRAFFREYFRHPFLFVALAAIGITAYSIIDSKGLELLRSGTLPFSALRMALFYIAFENLFILACLCLYVPFSTRERTSLNRLRVDSLRYPLLAGPATTTAYVLVLLAMQLASNVSYVVAFRQLSILFGVVFGFLVLRERVTAMKLAGTALILVGLVLTALGSA